MKGEKQTEESVKTEPENVGVEWEVMSGGRLESSGSFRSNNEYDNCLICDSSRFDCMTPRSCGMAAWDGSRSISIRMGNLYSRAALRRCCPSALGQCSQFSGIRLIVIRTVRFVRQTTLEIRSESKWRCGGAAQSSPSYQTRSPMSDDK